MDANPQSPAEFGNFDVSRKGPVAPKDVVAGLHSDKDAASVEQKRCRSEFESA